jgi:hypothetical protein
MQTHSVDSYLAEIAKTTFLAGAEVPHSFAYMVKYYRKGAPRKRNFFRACSTAVVLIGAMLPAVASLGHAFPSLALAKDVGVIVLSFAVAALTGVLAHYRWEVGWRSQNEALFALEALRANWEAVVARARSQSGEPGTLEQLDGAFGEFQRRTFEVVHAEMGEFFKVQQVPIGAGACSTVQSSQAQRPLRDLQPSTSAQDAA